MREITCHYCDRTVMRLESGSKVVKGVVCVCKRCSELEGIVADEKPGPVSGDDGGLYDLMRRMGMR